MDPTESNSNGSTEPESSEENQFGRVMVLAAAGSSPVAHPSKVLRMGLVLRANQAVLPDGDIHGDSFQANQRGTTGDAAGDKPPSRFEVASSTSMASSFSSCKDGRRARAVGAGTISRISREIVSALPHSKLAGWPSGPSGLPPKSPAPTEIRWRSTGVVLHGSVAVDLRRTIRLSRTSVVSV